MIKQRVFHLFSKFLNVIYEYTLFFISYCVVLTYTTWFGLIFILLSISCLRCVNGHLGGVDASTEL